jgi:hypothetical protein
VAIANAISADLNANIDLAPKTTWLYSELIVILPDKTPLVAVWCEVTDFRLILTTPACERRHNINVAWYKNNPKQSDVDGVGDPAIV